ncbi:DNA cytosine methyltransferase [Paenibacillus sp. 1781tsa1]|uniref:DNA cytosine methyltransferase n=1 Tax=Paenibacillus sp. 1781tsa1 TaxID=2953810 RepID=UPI00209E5B13|nr:DNA cytosine methyltransferase [Paenibacillus sp. 1781tsa1]MCP1187469.1 DNA cytosine methyltransferase [Paenibacillus sp. 1781tsa1]
MRVADFFCGAGGFSEGFRQAGFRTLFAVDKWLPAVNTHHGNHPHSNTILDDVERISLLPDKEFHELVPDTEIIIGSPPCVAFSNSNKSGKGDKSLGIKLLESYLRIVARKKYKSDSVLKYWVLENVPNIEGFIKPTYNASDLGLQGTFELQVLFENSGVYNSKNFGVAQNRKRFLCGEFPSPQLIVLEERDVRPLRLILNALGDPLENLDRMIDDPNYNFQMNSIDVTDHHFIKELAPYEWQKAKQLKEDKGYMGRMSFPEDVNRPARTVMANSSVSSRESIIYKYKNSRYRVPTVRELASVMSFPIDYKFFGDSRGIKSKLVGNAVPPKMAFAFAKSIAEQLGREVPYCYKPIQHSLENEFTDLNHTIFNINEEKPKKDVARFKYHIPYLIVNAFRVELTNYKSDFENKEFIWSVEIHKSQGPKAKIYIPLEESFIFTDSTLENEIELCIDAIKQKLVSFNQFQQHHCLTSEQRMGLIGPYEMLDYVKEFILKTASNISPSKLIQINEEPKTIPVEIAIGYVVLKKLIEKMRCI